MYSNFTMEAKGNKAFFLAVELKYTVTLKLLSSKFGNVSNAPSVKTICSNLYYSEVQV